MSFFRSALWPGLVVAVRTIVSIAINKLVAVYYGPGGITLLAHFQNLVSFFLSIQADGVNVGVLRFLSSGKGDAKQRSAYFNAGLLLNLLFFLIPCLFLFIFSNTLVTLFDAEVNSKTWLFIFLAGVFLQMLSFYFITVILADKKLRLYALVNVVASLFSLVLSFFAAKNYSLTMVLLAVAVSPAISILITFYYFIKRSDLYFLNSFILDTKPYKELLKFCAMAVSIMVFGKVTDFLVRQFAIEHFSLFQTGLWQSAVKLSDSYTAAFTAIMGAVYFPKVSELQSSTENLKVYVRKIGLSITAILLVGFTLVSFFKEQVLLLLYHSEFVDAEQFVNYQLVGDFFKLLSFLLAYIVIARAKTGLFILLEGASSLVYILFIFLFINSMAIDVDSVGIELVQFANILRYFIYLVVLIIINRRYIF